MNYLEATKISNMLNYNLSKIEDGYGKFTKNEMGLISDSDRKTEEFIDLNRMFKAAFNEMREFNKWYVKEFKKEIRKNRGVYPSKSPL